jgi:hypothetical protein
MFSPRIVEESVESTTVNAEEPNLSLNDPSLTARAVPADREAKIELRSEGKAYSLIAHFDKSGSASSV